MRLTLAATVLCVGSLMAGCNRSAVGVDANRVKPGMSAEAVRKELGTPFPGPVNDDRVHGVRTETWIYPAGDDAVFVMLQNGVVQRVNKQRVTMKDAAKRIALGMSESQVKSLIGDPSGDGLLLDGRKTTTYVNNDAALDTLNVTYRNGQVAKIEVLPNSAIAGDGNQGSR